MRTFADRDPDRAGGALVWPGASLGTARIATLDMAEFSVYRLNGRKRFEMELLS